MEKNQINKLSNQIPNHQESSHADEKTNFGFWIYLMTDLIMFGALFAVFAVLRNNTYGGPGPKELFELKFVFTETLILLISSFTIGLALIASYNKSKFQTLLFLGITFCLGLSFLILELSEFKHLMQTGNSWAESAFLSSYFALLGMHGIHIFIGLIALLLLTYKIFKNGFLPINKRWINSLSIFWHFLDIVWIFIFTIVYLIGFI